MTTTQRPRIDILPGGRAVRIIVPDHRIDQTYRIDDADHAIRRLHLHRFLDADEADRMLIEIHERLMEIRESEAAADSMAADILWMLIGWVVISILIFCCLSECIT